jgi:hypothetical protein
VCVKKKKSQWRSSRREREKCASVFCVIIKAEVTFKDDRGLKDRAIARQNHINEYTLNALQVTKEVFAGRKAGG